MKRFAEVSAGGLVLREWSGFDEADPDKRPALQAGARLIDLSTEDRQDVTGHAYVNGVFIAPTPQPVVIKVDPLKVQLDTLTDAVAALVTEVRTIKDAMAAGGKV